MIKLIKTALSVLIVLLPSLFFSQETKQMTADEVARLAINNHQQIKVSAHNIGIAKQQTDIVKLQKLPTITASTSQFYLANVVAIDKDFSNSTSITMPHYGSSYAVQATQLIFKGGLVHKSIELADLREQLSELDLEKNKQDVKFPGDLQLFGYLQINQSGESVPKQQKTGAAKVKEHQ